MSSHAEHSEDAGRFLKRVETDLGAFGNRTDIVVVDEVVRGASLLECTDSDVFYFNNNSPSPSGDGPQLDLFDEW